MSLKIIQKQSGKKIVETAKELKIPLSTYNRYLAGVNEPNIDTLKKLSQYFNVTIDAIVDNDTTGITTYSDEQFEIIKILVKLNENNLLKLYGYASGLLAMQN